MQSGQEASPIAPRARRIDRRKVLVAVLIASGYIVALVLGAVVLGAQVRGWNEDAMIIGAFADSFNGTARSLRFFLTTRDFSWANESIWWLATAADIAQDHSMKGGFPSGAPLNLTLTNLHCAITVQVAIVRNLQQDPSQLDAELSPAGYLGRVEGLDTNLSGKLDIVRPTGADPLAQLQPDRIQPIRGTMGEIHSLSYFRYGYGGCPVFERSASRGT